MSPIKNLFLLESKLTPEAKDELEVGASLYKRFSNVTFEVIQSDETGVTIKTVQGRNIHDNYFPSEMLEDRTIKLFERVLPLSTGLQVVVEEFKPSL